MSDCSTHDKTFIPSFSSPSASDASNDSVEPSQDQIKVDSEQNEVFFVPKKVALQIPSASSVTKIFVKCSKNTKEKRLWDKKQVCIYCSRTFAKLPRHLETMHPGEPEVKKLLSLAADKGDTPETKKLKIKMRKDILDELKRKGNYSHNIRVLKKGAGELIVKRCPTKQLDFSNYLPCHHCFEFFFKKDLGRHIKNCSCRDREETSDKPVVRVQSHAAMLLPQNSEVSEALGKIFGRMRVDEVSMLLKFDTTIIKYGNSLCHKHFNNDDQTYHISNKLRELGRLLLTLREKKIVKTMNEVINPQLFPAIVQTVTSMCRWDEKSKTIETPSLGIKLGQVLTKVAYLVKGEAIISNDNDMRSKADDFLFLLDKKWGESISKISHTELEKRKWNKPHLLPLTEDLKALKLQLSEVMNKSVISLAKDNNDKKAWKDLCTSTLATIVIFNRRRQGEAAKFNVGQLKELKKGEPHPDIKKTLTHFEQSLCNTFKRVEIRGKKGRKVPMILTRKLEKNCLLLVKLRDNVGINPKNKYVFAVQGSQSLNFVRGSDAIRKHVRQCNSLKCPMAITSTKLRKHIATLSQLINLEEKELEMLAGYLGHDISVHREFYRLPEDTLQIAKCGKLLMLMDQGNFAENSGKRLDEIDVNLQGW